MRAARPTVAVRSWVVLLALVSACAGLGGCTTARNLLGTRISPCFRVLPKASDAVRDLGAPGPRPLYVGVQWLAATDVVKAVQNETHAGAPPRLVSERRRGVCAVAFRGNFSPALATSPWVPEPGPYRIAIAVVRQSDERVLATVLLQRPPRGLHFSKRFAFLR